MANPFDQFDGPPPPPGFNLDPAPTRAAPPAANPFDAFDKPARPAVASLPPGFKLDTPAPAWSMAPPVAPPVPVGTMRAPADPRAQAPAASRHGILDSIMGEGPAAAVRGFGASLIPSAAGVAGFGAGMAAATPASEAAAAALAATGIGAPLAPVVGIGGPLIGGLAGSMGGSAIGSRVQKFAVDHLPDGVVNALGMAPETVARDTANHPNMQFAGELAALVPFFKPGFVGKIPALIGGGLGGGMEGERQIEEGKFEPAKLAMATAAGAVLQKPTRMGARLLPGHPGAPAINEPAPAPVDPINAAPPVDPLQADIDTLHRFGVDPTQFSSLDMIPGAAARLRANEARGGTAPNAGAVLPDIAGSPKKAAGRVDAGIEAGRVANTNLEAGLDDGSIHPAAVPAIPEFGRTLPDDAVIPVTRDGQGIDPRTAGAGTDAATGRQDASEAHRVELGRAATASDPVYDSIVKQLDAYGSGPRDARYNKLQALLDARLAASPEPTAPADASVMRAPDQSAATGTRADPYSFDPIGKPNGDAPDTGNMGRAEDPNAPRAPNPAGNMGNGTGDSSRPFKTDPTDPNGPTFEAAAEAKRKAAHDEMLARFEASRKAHDEATKQRQTGNRFNDERTADASADPQAAYKGKYGQKPHKPADTWAMTPEGYVADKGGLPVAFRNPREAARFAADNELGGDFDLAVWGTSKRGQDGRVVLKKRAGSTYGEAAPRGPETPPEGGPRSLPDQTGGQTREPFTPGRAPHPDKAGDGPVPRRAPAAEDTGLPVKIDAAEPENTRPRPPRENPFPEPAKASGPRSIVSVLKAMAKDRKPGERRFSFEDAVNHGVDPDWLESRRDLRSLFGKDKLQRGADGVVRQNQRQLNEQTIPFADLANQFDGKDYGMVPESGLEDGRLQPHELADLINRDAPLHADAESAQARADYDRMQSDIDEFHSRYGHDAHDLTDDQLNAIDYEQSIDDLHRAFDDEAASPDTWHGDKAWSAEHDRADSAGANDRPDQSNEAPRPGGGHFGATEPAPGRGGAGEGRAQDGEIRGRGDDRSANSFGRDARTDGGQSDAFGTTDAERRAKLERDAEGRKASAKPQRADIGGMFDDGHKQGDWVDAARNPFYGSTAFSNPFFDPAAWKWIANASLDAEKLGSDARAAVGKIKAAFGAPVSAAKNAVKRLDQFGSATLYSADSVFRSMAARFNAPTLTALADMFHAEAGKDSGTGRTYHEAVDRGIRTRTQRAQDALGPFKADKSAMARIKGSLTGQRVSLTGPEKVAASAIHALLKDTLAYRRAAGEEIGEVSSNFFPRVIDATKAIADQAGFLKAAASLYRDIGAKDPDASALAWLLRISDTHAGIDGATEHAGNRVGSAKSREFGAKADTVLREFYHADPFTTLASYLAGSVRKAEQARRFGAKGAEGSAERVSWTKLHGAKTQWEVMADAIKAELRASGDNAMGAMKRVEAVKDANLGRITPAGVGLSRAVSLAQTWNQLSKMDHATVSSLGDLAMGFVRGGPKYGIQHLSTSLHEFARQVARMPASEAARYAEAVGTANDAFASDLLRARAGEGHMQAGAHLVIDNFYRAIGLQQLTEGGRIAATKTGQRFIGDLAHDMASANARVKQRAAAALHELGVKDAAGFAALHRASGAPTRADLLADKGFAADYGTALLRYVNQSILMPSRAEKPAWASHPVGGLFFALQSYSYGFKKNVMDRGVRSTADAVKYRDPHMLAPASGLVVLAGLTYLNDTYLRPALFGSNYDYDSESPAATALRVADRAGVLGPLSPIVNAFQAVQRGRSMTEALSGPIVGSIAQGAEAAWKLVANNNPNTNTDERRAAGALYDLVLEPAMDLAASVYLKGPARSAAVLATGNKRGGMLPADKDAFVDAVAGSKVVPAGIASGVPWK